MNKEINKIISWIEMSYTRLNYKEELLLVNYIKQLQQENKKYKEVIDKAIEYIRSNDIEVLKYHDIPSETTSYEIVTVDLLKILRGGIK